MAKSWVVVAGCGQIMGGCGWLYVVVWDGCRWLYGVVVDGSTK